ncbi:TetR/AcrR family transcriptional regulator [Nonomuraea angiospora]|uniref:AcrR family transcriptional regulator n=1 Tax=Nonomuraea angiospora TaxID=46172 RepID=A0ABR9M3Z4_9ACTN|nr:TetR/AcrR family transcriptional regulator [Nonomuraea angiospora]MBE1587644.1 AcrR family transcriptional regulator [Nonomuraea angiospora]MDX3109623.1 TetR/AcrR family transcriptional regulator [Nonomuraea angiospora]
MVGRPRSEVARKAILRAALDLCARDGYQNVTMKGIAQAAGSGRQTVYRWWQTKAQVLLEALTDVLAEEVEGLPDTGDARADLVAFLEQTFALARGVAGQVVVGLMADAQSDAELAAELRAKLINPRRAALRAVLARGAVPADVELDLAVDLVFGAMWYRLLNRHAEVNQELAEEIAGLLARIN